MDENEKPPSDAAPSPKKQAVMDLSRRAGIRRRAYATPAACGICVAKGEDIVWKWCVGEPKCLIFLSVILISSFA